MSVRAVIFDWGGTLTPWHNVDVLGGWLRVAETVAPDRADEVAAALFAAERSSWEVAETQHRSSTIHDVIAAAGLEPAEERLEEAFDAYVEHWDPHTHTDGEVPAVFRGLRERGIKIGVLSNTHWPREWHERIFARDGVLDLIDGDVYTSEIGWTKPHPAAFHAALAAVGLTPEDAPEAVFVGDRPFDDVYGAKAVGMRGVLIPHSAVPAYDVEPDAVLHSLGELLEVVDRWRQLP